jgi:hypothetical protein
MNMAKRTGGSAGRGRRRDAASSEIEDRQKVIGAQLRSMFDVVVNEPVPDEFLRLLEQAEKAPKRGNSDG